MKSHHGQATKEQKKQEKALTKQKAKKAKDTKKQTKKVEKQKKQALKEKIRLRKKGIFAEDFEKDHLSSSQSDSQDHNNVLDEELPDFLSPSGILVPEDRRNLYKFLPRRFRFHDLEKLFSTDTDGCSRTTFQARVAGREPTLLVIKDSNSNVFGAFATNTWQASKESHFVGTGETFLFTLRPEPRIWKWSKTVQMYQLCSKDCIAFGGKQHGLWIGDGFEIGRTTTCDTFLNDPLTSEDFKISLMEVWGLQLKQFTSSSSSSLASS